MNNKFQQRALLIYLAFRCVITKKKKEEKLYKIKSWFIDFVTPNQKI